MRCIMKSEKSKDRFVNINNFRAPAQVADKEAYAKLSGTTLTRADYQSTKSRVRMCACNAEELHS